jgi:hypothetical protein
MANTAKIIEKLKPIKAAKPCRHNWATGLLGLLPSTMLTPNMAAKGAKITIHFITPVKKNCSNSGVVPTQ